MASAFDDLPPFEAEHIRKRLLAGDRMHEIRTGTDITAKQMRAMRDEVFGPLINDPDAVKALANGPCLNPNAIIHYTHSRKTIQRSLDEQTELFPQ